MIKNPFVLRSYVSDDLFCDREKETSTLRNHITNGRDVTLIAPRRVGKTGLIEHFFNQPDIKRDYNTILIDLYATKDMSEMVQVMGKAILSSLMSKSEKAAKTFLSYVKSLHTGVRIADNGDPEITLGLGSVDQPEITVDEIFNYINHSDKPSLIAIDEFQTVSGYSDGNAEALLRTYIQHCSNAHFIFSGSQRTMMSEMFMSAARPFFQSTTIMNIDVLNKSVYADFASTLFEKYGKNITADTINKVYDDFEGITWYIQRMMNELFAETQKGETCNADSIAPALDTILTANNFTYESILYQLPIKQKALLYAISKVGKATQIMSSEFIKAYGLPSSSSVQSAAKGLIDKELITNEFGTYEIYDKFFAIWLRNRI